MPTTFVILFLSLFVAVGVGLLGYGIRSLVLSNAAKTWPTTEGRIESCELTQSIGAGSRGSRSTIYQVDVRYSYTVAGQQRTGDRIAFGYSGSNVRAAHQGIADKLSSAKTVLVRYDPDDPTRAVLSYGLNRSTFFFLVFGTAWLVIVTCLAVLFHTNSRSDGRILNTLVTTE